MELPDTYLHLFTPIYAYLHLFMPIYTSSEKGHLINEPIKESLNQNSIKPFLIVHIVAI